MGPEKSMAFHRALQEAAAACGSRGWSGRRPRQSTIHAIRHTRGGRCRAPHFTAYRRGHVGLEDVHRNGDVPFVAMRFGGLFGQGRHPVKALLKGHSPRWRRTCAMVHEEDAAAACVFTALCEGPLPGALNVVAPEVRTRRELLSAAFPATLSLDITPGGVQRKVSSHALTALGFSFQVQDPLTWVQSRGTVTDEGVWEGPHGPLNWTRAPGPSNGKGCALMVHGYKGFRHWGPWRASLSAGRRKDGTCTAWISHTTAMSHPSQRTVWTKLRGVKTGTTTKQKKWPSRCKNWPSSTETVVMGHSRGGWMAVLGARQFQKAGGSLSGVACWAPVSDVFARFPWGPALKDWEASDRL